jgi:hypothetical protein
MLTRIVMGHLPSREAVALLFRLWDSWFMVNQGGDSSLINHHNSRPAQPFALRLSARNQFDFRAEGSLPDEINRYGIFGKPVVSSSAGTVRRA